MKTFSTFFFLGLLSVNAFAVQNCELTITRSACPGKESQAFANYKGQNPTVETMNVGDSAGCTAQAVRFSKIARAGVISRIAVAPKFQGTALPQVAVDGRCAPTR